MARWTNARGFAYGAWFKRRQEQGSRHIEEGADLAFLVVHYHVFEPSYLACITDA
jgi:hypothetical protein